MKDKKQRRVIFFLVLGCVVLIAGIITEFVIYRYTTNRSVAFKSDGNRIQILQGRNWQDFNTRGVIIGTERTGYIVDSAVSKDEYSRWFKQLAAMDINVIRINIVQNPAFYQAFFKYNMLTDKPIYLLQGIYIDESYIISQNNAYSDELNSDYFEEIRRTVDVVHGRTVVKPRAGRASGTYNMNIAPYVMGYILYGKTDAGFMDSTNLKNSHVIGFEGDYLYTVNASPYEAWFAGVGNYVISYEQDHYKGPHKLMGWGGIDFDHVHSTEKYYAGVLIPREDFPLYPFSAIGLPD